MTKLPRGLETKPVFDWDHEPLGTIQGSEHDADTQDPTSLIVDLTNSARDRLGTDRETLTLPFEYVYGIRRDEVRLSRGADEILDALPEVAEDEDPQAVHVPA